MNTAYVTALEDALLDAAKVLEQFARTVHTHRAEGCAGCATIFTAEWQDRLQATIDAARQITARREQ